MSNLLPSHSPNIAKAHLLAPSGVNETASIDPSRLRPPGGTSAERMGLATATALSAVDIARVAFFLLRRPSMFSTSRRVKFRA